MTDTGTPKDWSFARKAPASNEALALWAMMTDDPYNLKLIDVFVQAPLRSREKLGCMGHRVAWQVRGL